MATVFLAHDLKHRRAVAIKLLHESIADSVFADRFVREIRIVAQLTHPGILGLIDSGTIAVDGADLPYYVMPRVEGETLRERMEREKTMSIEDVLDITRQVADALAYAHARNVVHRDIKPENIMLTGSHVQVADFGIAKALSDASTTALTTEGGMPGTPAYMSPEQVTDATVSPASDVFSLGVVAYELLAGELPFGGTTAQAQLTRRLYDTPTPLRKLRPAVPPEIEQVVSKMLERSPRDRYATGAEVSAALSTKVSTPAGGASRRLVIAAGALALVLVAAVAFRLSGGASSSRGAAGPRSIAVLPFANVGTDTSNEYFGDGIADELAGSLAKVPGLRVAARSSAFQFKGKNVAARDIAERLGVDAVVEGSVRPMGDRILIIAQLVSASDGLSLWSGRYERPAAEAFDVQAAITDSIATSVGLRRAPAVRANASNSRAYDAFLQGRWHYAKRNRQGFEAAIRYFQLALHEDTTYARAWAGLGDAYSLLGAYGWSEPSIVFEQARTAANRAVALDSTLTDAHTALGLIHLFYDRDWNGSRLELETARRLDPKYGEARLFYGWYLLAMHRDSAAVDSLRSAAHDEPVSLILNLRFASMLMFSGRFPEAKAQLAHVLELSSDFPLANLDLARIAVVQGQYDLAAQYLTHAPEKVSSYGSGVHGVVLAKTGKKADALAEAERLQHGYGSNESALAAAHVFTALGDADKAFDALGRAYDRHESMLFAARSDPLLTALRTDPRWAEFIGRMRFP